MKVCLKSVAALAALAAFTASGAAMAQSAHQWTAEVGIGEVTPDVESGDVSAPALPHTKADIGSSTKPVFSISYGLTDNWAVQLALGVPLKHELYGAGAIAGTGKLGSVKALPPTALLQYRFGTPSSVLRPYVGAGATYAYFADETGSGQLTAITNTGSTPVSFEVDNKLCLSLQAGLTVNINERWFADFKMIKTRLRTQVHYSSGQQQDMRLDPKLVAVAIGYKF